MISRISSGNNGAFSGSYQSGDLMIICAFNAGGSTPPNTPSGYTGLGSGSQPADGSAMAIFYKFATSGSETYPTISNSTSSVYAIYRGVDTTAPFVQLAGQASSGESSTIAYSGISSFQNPASDWVIAFGVAHAETGNIGSHPPTSLELPTNAEFKDSANDVAIFDSDGALSSYSYNTKTLDASVVWITKTVELVADSGAPTAKVITDQATPELVTF